MLLTPQQQQEILEIIRKAHQAFIVKTVQPSIEDSYLYGQLLAQLNNSAVQNMSYAQFKQWIAKNPVPLTAVERDAINAAKFRAGEHCKGLGNRVDAQTGQILIEADSQLRAQLRDTIKTKTAENIARRETVKKLKSELGWATRDWARDWDRIAITEKHEVHQSGVKDNILKRYGSDATVFKRPMPDACSHCKRLHLGPDGHPRLFKLSDLEANGTNVGRKAMDWLPVVGAVHPHCQCQLVRMPAGWGFNEEGDMAPGGEFGVLYEEGTVKALLELEDELMKALTGGGYVEFQNLPINVENPAGSVRQWTDSTGATGETRMIYAYGEIEGTEGIDGDPIDVFLGPDPKAKEAFIIEQQDPHCGRYDEQKVMLGFSNQSAALSAYQAHYNRTDFAQTITPMQMDAFKRWAKLTKPNTMSLKKGPRLVVPFQKDFLEKSSIAATAGPFIGERGGLWADIKHTIPWKKKDTVKPKVDTKKLLEGNFGIKRIDMPQIRSDLVPQFIEELRSSGVKVKNGKQQVGKLKATQSELHADKVQSMIENPKVRANLAKPIIVSSDGFILDGHHRWAAMVTMSPKSKIPTVEVNLPMKDLLERAGEFSGVQFKKSDLELEELDDFLEKGGPYLGKRGGKWADPQHTIPWKEPKARAVVTLEVPSELPPTIGKRVAAVMDKLRGDFPELADVQVKMGSPEVMGDEIHSTKNLKALYLNPNVWLNPKKLETHAKEWDGLLIDSSVEGIITHEMGHVLANRVLRAIGADKFNELRFKHLKDPGSIAMTESPSVYGQEHPSEFEAEAFVALVQNRAVKSKFADEALKTSKAFWKDMLDATRTQSKLSKAENRYTPDNHVGPATSQAGNRAPAIGGGSGANYVFPLPESKPPKTIEQGQSYRIALDEAEQKSDRAIRRDKSVYDVADNAKVVEAKPIEIVPTDAVKGARDDTEYRRARVEAEFERRKKKLPPNRRPVTKEDVERAKCKKTKKGEVSDAEIRSPAESSDLGEEV